MAYRHVVLFRVRRGVPEAEVAELCAGLRALGGMPGILHWRVERSLDDRKGTILIEDATFADRDAFEAFRADPRHRAQTDAAAQIADWWVGDYLE